MAKENKLKAAQCPTCGRWMDKVEALVVKNLQEGTVPIATNGSNSCIAWVCANASCRKM